jgi:hypothetical protein
MQNRAYDGFTAAYGSINKTSITTAEDGTVTRRMPNLAQFRADPTAMLVMALEHYDEITGKANTATIMHQNVVGSSPLLTSVSSAEEGLRVSLNHKGTVQGYAADSCVGNLCGMRRETSMPSRALLHRCYEERAWESCGGRPSGTGGKPPRASQVASTRSASTVSWRWSVSSGHCASACSPVRIRPQVAWGSIHTPVM